MECSDVSLAMPISKITSVLMFFITLIAFNVFLLSYLGLIDSHENLRGGGGGGLEGVH